MTVHLPVMLQPASGDASLAYTGQEWRNYINALGSYTEAISGQQGVATAADYKVTQRGAGANFSVDVAAGYAYVFGGDVTNQGLYVAWNDGTVNVVTPAAPATGTQVHRVVLQIQDKLSNGVWTGYQGVIMLLADTGSGTPAQPASAITLAFVSIAAGQASVQNANITDYRQRVGIVGAAKTGDTGRTATTTLTDDPDLQLLNLQAAANYFVFGNILYSAPNGNDIQFTWRGQNVFKYNCQRQNLAAAQVGATSNQGSDVVTAGGQGGAQNMGLTITGRLLASAAPAVLVFQWAQNVSGGTTTVRSYSILTAIRVS